MQACRVHLHGDWAYAHMLQMCYGNVDKRNKHIYNVRCIDQYDGADDKNHEDDVRIHENRPYVLVMDKQLPQQQERRNRQSDQRALYNIMQPVRFLAHLITPSVKVSVLTA
jgi:hypothetical protein